MNSRHTGFTLIELLVVMAITGILAATAIVNFGKNEDRDVRQEKDRLTSFLREVQNKSLTAEVPPKSLAPASCYDASNKFVCNKICGYGVKSASASSTSLQVYFVYNLDVNSDCMNLASSTMDDLEVFYVQKGVSISSPNDIFFHTPNGEVSCGGCTLPATVSITKGSSIDVNVKVDDAGRIY